VSTEKPVPSGLVALSEKCPQCLGSGVYSVLVYRKSSHAGVIGKINVRDTRYQDGRCSLCGGLTVVSKNVKNQFEEIMTGPAGVLRGVSHESTTD
jgi:hypothetical protein